MHTITTVDVLPRHPRTGLRAIGIGRRGPIWPVMGGDGTGDGSTGQDGGQTGDADQTGSGSEAGTGQQSDKGGTDLAALPDDIKKLISDLRSENASHRTGKKAAETAAAAEKAKLAGVLKAIGVKPDGTEDIKPEEIAAKLEQANSAAWQRGVKLQVFTIASKHGADPTALLDSMTFIDSLDDLVDVDPDSADFAKQLESKIKAAVKDNPKFKATPAGPARSGGDMSGGSGEKRTGQRPTLGAAIAAAYKT